MPFLRKKKKEPWFVWSHEQTFRTGLRHSIYYPGGGYYKGEWLKGYQSGKGKQLLPGGRQYEGDWACNREHGFGIQSQFIRDEKRFKLTYIGDHLNGKMDGFGRRHYDDGTIYEGEFKRNKRHGFGKCWYADASYYEGQWSKDQPHGSGLFVQVNGNRYEGAWRDGEKDGWGRFYHLDSGQVQDGFWVKGTCSSSFVKDIPFRQSALEPTPYPIPSPEIASEASCVQFLNRAGSVLQGQD